jgi:ectoine hydroxylase-related dioxygenase (phytanoyl-CoA dioxygenase family)
VLRGVFKPPTVESLCADVQRVFAQYPPDVRDPDDDPDQMAPFRYEMLNRSALVQRAIANPRILRAIEPLLGEDCHVISNTAWWQPPGNNEHLGRFWHIDAGPHVPRDPDIPWDERIPYPIFAIAAHIFLRDCPPEAGPTAVIPRSHTSGQPPPFDRLADGDLEWNGRRAIPLTADAGDVALFVSDIWHSRLPPAGDDPGRVFIQCHYVRRDIAQRLRPTSSVHHLSEQALRRARTPRQQTLVGHHPPGFYDG